MFDVRSAFNSDRTTETSLDPLQHSQIGIPNLKLARESMSALILKTKRALAVNNTGEISKFYWCPTIHA